jgi:hypothetical protein
MRFRHPKLNSDEGMAIVGMLHVAGFPTRRIATLFDEDEERVLAALQRARRAMNAPHDPIDPNGEVLPFTPPNAPSDTP